MVFLLRESGSSLHNWHSVGCPFSAYHPMHERDRGSNLERLDKYISCPNVTVHFPSFQLKVFGVIFESTRTSSRGCPLLTLVPKVVWYIHPSVSHPSIHPPPIDTNIACSYTLFSPIPTPHTLQLILAPRRHWSGPHKHSDKALNTLSAPETLNPKKPPIQRRPSTDTRPRIKP